MAAKKTSGFKLKQQVERAAALARAGRWHEVLPLARDLAPQLKSSEGYRLLVGALESMGREHEAQEASIEGWRRFDDDLELGVRAGFAFYVREQFELAAPILQRVVKERPGEAEVLVALSHALYMLGRKHEALAPARAAWSLQPQGASAFVYGLIRVDRGELEEAEEPLAAAVATLSGSEKDFCQGLLGQVRFWRGDLRGALSLWRELDRDGRLAPDLLHYRAMAEAIEGDETAARDALARGTASGGTGWVLAQARVELALNHPAEALGALDRLGDPAPDVAPMVFASRGRALRMLGRHADARALLEPLAPEASGILGAMILVDLARMKSDEGLHEEAAALFERALALDPSAQEAESGLALANERIAWREAVAADADTRVDAARSEAQAMRRAFAEREREIQMLKARLAQAERAAGRAREEAERAREQAARARQESVQAELQAQEAEAARRSDAALERAFGDALGRCPESLREALRVAELSYQRTLLAEMPAAAVAVLFSGALERGLYLLLVRPFDQGLAPAARESFLRIATRELRAGRVEYFDRFVEAFDPARHARAPSLGEVARALSRRREAHLAPFARFLEEHFELDAATLDAMATFVEQAKEQLRDPVAHGRTLDLPHAELSRFRTALLFDLDGRGSGLLPLLVRARRPGSF